MFCISNKACLVQPVFDFVSPVTCSKGMGSFPGRPRAEVKLREDWSRPGKNLNNPLSVLRAFVYSVKLTTVTTQCI